MLKFKIWRYLGLLIFVFILFKIDWIQLKKTIYITNILWVIISFLINIPQLWLKSTRWRILLSGQGHFISNRDAFLIYLSSIYLGIITPGRLGEFSKASYLKQEGITSLSRGFSSVLVDRLYDLYLLFFIAMVGFITIKPWPWAGIFGLVGIFIAIVIPLHFLFLNKIKEITALIYKKFLFPKIPEFAKERTEQFSKGFNEIIRWKIWQTGLLTVSSYALFFLQCFLIAKALNINISFLDIIPIMAITNLITFIPISISGLGTREAVLMFLLLPRGISMEMVLSYSIGILFIFFVGGGIIGLIAWWLKPLELKSKKE